MNDHLTVNEFLDSVNEELADIPARVIGEVTEIQLYPDRSYLFFKIKDKAESAVMSCFMWKRDYKLSGVDLEAGLEVIVSGFPEVFKPNGRFSFKTQTVEHVGEGKLKKAYDELKTRLEKEGVFTPARKRPLPVLPTKVGLITSKDGAAIGDFQVNLGSFGFKVLFVDSRVEGQLAAPELLDSIRTIKKQEIEVLVIVRGGGSLESLLPFNNETLVREVMSFPVPVLVGVGHEKDVPLIALAADKMVSTPTAAAQALNFYWEKAANTVQFNHHKILTAFARELDARRSSVVESFHIMREHLQSILDDFRDVENTFLRASVAVRARIAELYRLVDQYPATLMRDMHTLFTKARDYLLSALESPVDQVAYALETAQKEAVFRAPVQALVHALTNTRRSLLSMEKLLESNNPERQLKLGYSIASAKGKLVRSVGQIRKGDRVDVRVQDGSFGSEITDISKKV